MGKAEDYLSARLEKLLCKRESLNIDAKAVECEINETEDRVEDMKRNIDDTFEIFSPRKRENDFFKSEIKKLEDKITGLTDKRNKIIEQSKKADDEINVIKDILNESLDDRTDTDINKIMLEKEKILKSVSDIAYKCDMCSKVIQVDAVRAKLEADVMLKNLNDLNDSIRSFTDECINVLNITEEQ